MFFTSFKVTISAILEIFIIGLVGFVLVKRRLLSREGLDILTQLVIFITLPLLIICRFIQDFDFQSYPNWWLYPILSIAIAALGFFVVTPFIYSTPNPKEKRQFLSLVGFQNSGYLPLALVAALLSREEAAVMFIYIFLYLVGFNLLIWSVVPYFLTYHKKNRFEFAKLFSPPVLATLFGLVLVYLGAQRFIPQFIFRPLKMIGDCTLPLALFVVGGSLAEVKLKQGTNKKAIFWVILAKLMIMPTIILIFLSKVKIPYLLGLFLLIQAAMPSATSLSIIIRQSKEEDYLINSSIFIGHIISIFSIPLFLTLYYFMIQ